MFKLAIKKILNNKALMLSLFTGILSAIVIVCTIPMFSQAISHRMLVTQLENYQDANNVSPSSVVVSCSLSAFTRRDEDSTNLDNFKFCDEYLQTDLFKNLYMPALVKSKTLSCAKMFSADQRDKKLSTVNQVVLKATDTYENAIKIIDGRMPQNSLDENGYVEVMISRAHNVSSKYAVGTVLNLAYNKTELDVSSLKEPLVKVIIVGVFDYEQNSYSPFVDKDNANELYCDYELFYSHIFEQKNLCTSATWYYAGDFTKYDLNKIEETISAIDRLNTNINAWGLTGNVKTVVPPIEQYMRYYDNVNSVNILLVLFYSPVLILIMFFIFMISKFVVETDKNEISMLNSRGASRKQIVLLYFLQGGTIAIIGIILAPVLSLIICSLLGTTSGFLEFSQRAPLKTDVSINSIVFSLIAACIAILTMLIPVYNSAKVEIVAQKRKKSNKYLETVILAIFTVVTGLISGYSYYNLVYQGLGVITPDGSVQPLAYVFLICLFLFIALLFVLIYPLIIKAVFKVSNKKWKPAKYSAFSRISNMEIKEKFIIIFLTLTIAIGAFSSVCARTLNYNIDNSLIYQYPCDIMADVQFYSIKENEQLKRRFLFNDIEGIEATRVVKGYQPRLMTRRGKMVTENLNMLAIETDKFSEIVQWNADILPNSLDYYMDVLNSETDSCIISSNVASLLEVKKNDVIYLRPDSNLKSNIILPVVVGEIVEAWPTYSKVQSVGNGETNIEQYLIVVNVEAVDRVAPNMSYSVWMNTDKSVNDLKILTVKLGAEAENLQDKTSTRLTNIVNGTKEKYMGQINPLRQATNGSLTFGFIAVMFICAVGFIIYWMISIKSRTLQIGTMRALGMSFKEVYQMVLWEQILICFASLFLGIISGVVSGFMFSPLLQSAFGTMGDMPPYKTMFEIADIIKLLILILILIIISVCAGIVMLKKIKATTAVKLGEE